MNPCAPKSRHHRHLIVLILVWLCTTTSTDALAEAAFSEGRAADGQLSHSFAWNHPTKDAATADAMTRCSQLAFNCVIRHQFNNACFALAYADRGGYGTGFGANDTEARQEAIGTCRRYNPQDNCRVVRQFCDTVNEEGLAAQQRAQQEQAQARQHYRENVSACRFQSDIDACDRALAYEGLSDAERERVSGWRGEIAEQQEQALQATAAARQRAEEERERLHAQKRFAEAFENCRSYVMGSCLEALNIQAASADDIKRLQGWLTTAQAFMQDRAFCEVGSVEACDRALASPAVVLIGSATVLHSWRVRAVSAQRTQISYLLEVLDNAYRSARAIPLSLIASVIGCALVWVLFLASRHRKMLFTSHRQSPSSTAEAPVSVQLRAARVVHQLLSAVEALHKNVGQAKYGRAFQKAVVKGRVMLANAKAKYDKFRSPPQRIRDTPAAIAALTLAHAYLAELEEIATPDADDNEGQRALLTTLSLITRQLKLVNKHDPDAVAEITVEGKVVSVTLPFLQSCALVKEGIILSSTQPRRAMRALEQALSITPNDHSAHAILGELHYNQHNKQRAVDALQKAVALAPENMLYRKLLDRAENLSVIGIAGYKVTRAGEHVFDTAIGVANTGIRTWNVFARIYNIVTFPLRIVYKIVMGIKRVGEKMEAAVKRGL